MVVRAASFLLWPGLTMGMEFIPTFSSAAMYLIVTGKQNCNEMIRGDTVVQPLHANDYW
jgi:hypothetical protein